MDIYAITTLENLEAISRHCPASLGTYLQCIVRANQEGFIEFKRSMVDIDMSEDWGRFRRNIKALAREHLLEWNQLNGNIQVTLAIPNGEE